jgi:hypothetical protein
MTDSYLGNPNLQRAGVKRSFTKEQVEEWLRCANDPIYFIENYMTIINLDEGEVKFKLRDYQKEMITSMVGNRFTLLATARQVGKSTTTCGFLLHYAIFNAHQSIVILANKGETAIEILERVQFSYERLPMWLKHGVVVYNKKKFELENGSKILAAASSASAVRGYSINCLFIDECAFVEGWDQFAASVLPTVTSAKKSKVILVSTPNGLNHFYKYYIDSKEERNDFNVVEVTWRQVPGRDEEWRKSTLGMIGNDLTRFAAEYDVEFQGSSGTLIAGWKLKELVHQTPSSVKDGLSVYQEPVAGHQYNICADVSEGKGLDYSAYSVIDVSQIPYVQVAAYRNNQITATDYAHQLHSTAKRYNDATILIEVNIALGPEVAKMIKYDFEYDNVLFTANDGANKKRISSGFGGNTDAGLRTTTQSKATGCSMLKLLIEGNQLILNDFHTIQELSTFARDSKKSYSAEEGKHDDTVMSLVLFGWLSGQAYFADITNINTLSHLTDRTDEKLLEDVMPFGFRDDHGASETGGVPGLELAPGESIVGQWN